MLRGTFYARDIKMLHLLLLCDIIVEMFSEGKHPGFLQTSSRCTTVQAAPLLIQQWHLDNCKVRNQCIWH